MKGNFNEQFLELTAKHRNLVLGEASDGRYMLRGRIGFTSSAKDHTIQDCYDVEIVIPSCYPDLVPLVTEVGGRIPDDFHRHPDKSLCLAAPIEQKRKFDKTKTLLGFVDTLVVPFLFQYSFYEKYGEMPFGDLSHGVSGIIEYYTELFKVEDNVIALSLLKILAEDNYRGHHKCPCGSGLILRSCHGPILLELKSFMPHSYYVAEYAKCVLKVGENSDVPTLLRSNKVVRLLEKIWKKGKKVPK